MSIVIAALFCRGLSAQIMATSGPIPPDSLGLPPSPPFLTLLGMASPGQFVTDPAIKPVGPVSEVLYEELRTTATAAGPAGGVEASRRSRFDQEGHITAQVENRWGRETETAFRYENGRLASVETIFPDAKKTQGKFWNYWFYNRLGKLQEYRRGSGTELQNHESNFQYDAKGRLLSFEYRQGADDKVQSRTEFIYSNDGKTIELTNRFLGTKIVDRSTRFLSDQGRVVRVILSNEGRVANDEAQNIRFRYDEKGRLVEQTTDAKRFSADGAEQDLPPGTISIVYDDNKHTKITSYSLPGEGTMRIAVTLDERGATIGYSQDGPASQMASHFDCNYDSYRNWTACSQIVVQEGRQSVAHRFRRTITYRTGGG